MQTSLSVVIITLNEEKNIARCLESVKSIADEIVVVDSYSTDKTKEICQAYGVNFIQRAWVGYAATKNYANSLAKFDYILSIDADEIISTEMLSSIQFFKKTTKFQTAFEVIRKNNYCGYWVNYCGWYPDKKIRLWPNGSARWVGEIHEKIIFDSPIKIELMTGSLYHYTFETIEQHLNQINKYSSVAAFELFKRGKKSGYLKIIFKPIIKFLRDYILHRGFLDGYYGFVICVNSAYSKFLKYVKLRELQKNAK